MTDMGVNFAITTDGTLAIYIAPRRPTGFRLPCIVPIFTRAGRLMPPAAS